MEQYLFLIPIATLLLFGAMTPGPSFLLVAQTSMSKSRSEALGVSVGLGLGAAVFACLAVTGLNTLFKLVPGLYLGLKILGGLYLCYLGIKIWRSSHDRLRSSRGAELENKSPLSAITFGLLTQLSNPKTAVVFSSVFAAMLPASVPEYTTIILATGVFILNFSWYAIVSLLLSSQKAQIKYLKFKSGINKVTGLLMGSIGGKFIVDGINP